MAELNDLQKVFESVGTRNPGCKNTRLLDVNPRFLEGALYRVAFDVDLAETTQTYERRVYVSKHSIEIFRNDEHLLDRIGHRQKHGLSEFFTSLMVVPQGVV
jgi:hypothetical protein